MFWFHPAGIISSPLYYVQVKSGSMQKMTRGHISHCAWTAVNVRFLNDAKYMARMYRPAYFMKYFINLVLALPGGLRGLNPPSYLSDPPSYLSDPPGGVEPPK